MKQPLLIVIAGPNGSGKTSLTEKIKEHEWFFGVDYINPDDIAKNLDGEQGSRDVIIRAANQAEDQREINLLNGLSMAFETVFSSPDKLEFIHRAKSMGYFVRLFFVGTAHPSINASRVALRVMEGGHDVPIPKIISRYSKSIAQCVYIAPYIGRMYLYDNSIENTEPKLFLRSSMGDVTKVYGDSPAWARGIVSALQAPKDGLIDKLSM